MDEKRYSLRTVGMMLNMTAMAVKIRANKVGVDTQNGLTAKDVKAIRDFKPDRRYSKKSTLDELRRELEVLG